MEKCFSYRPFTDFSEFDGFVCRIVEVDDFIHSRKHYVNNGLFEAINENECAPYGVYDNDTLAAFFAIRRDPKNIEAVEIAFLVVDRNYDYRGLGSVIIREIMRLTVDEYGLDLLTVEALVLRKHKPRPYDAVGFYLKCGFIRGEFFDGHKDTLSMYRPIIKGEYLQESNPIELKTSSL